MFHLSALTLFIGIEEPGSEAATCDLGIKGYLPSYFLKYHFTIKSPVKYTHTQTPGINVRL